MVVGQSGQLEIVRSCVVELKQRSELVVILYHPVGETIALANQ